MEIYDSAYHKSVLKLLGVDRISDEPEQIFKFKELHIPKFYKSAYVMDSKKRKEIQQVLKNPNSKSNALIKLHAIGKKLSLMSE